MIKVLPLQKQNMQVHIDITNTSFPNTKRLKMGLWDGISENSKMLQHDFIDDVVPKELIKATLKEQILKIIGEELEEYIDKALKENETR